MGVTRAIKRWAEPATLRRASVGAYVQGAWVAGADTVTAIRGMFAPSMGNEAANGNRRVEAPEGVIEEAAWFLWSLNEVNHDDVVVRDADNTLYRVIWVKDYSHLGSYWLAALKLESVE